MSLSHGGRLFLVTIKLAGLRSMAAFVSPIRISFSGFKAYDYGCNFQFVFVMIYTGFGSGEQVIDIGLQILGRRG